MLQSRPKPESCGGLPDFELSRETDSNRSVAYAFLLDPLNQQFRALVTDRISRLGHCGQTRVKNVGEGKIIEHGDSDVFWTV
jgi:hypothetical protein